MRIPHNQTICIQKSQKSINPRKTWVIACEKIIWLLSKMYKPHHHHPFRILLAIALATIAFTLWGFVWYATVFDDLWQSLITQGEDELIRLAEQLSLIHI